MTNFIRSLMAVAVVLCAAIPAHSNEELEALSRQYVNMPEVQGMTDKMFSADAMAAQFTASLPKTVKVTDEQKAAIGELMANEMSKIRPALETSMIKNTALMFTVAELKALIAFYQSEHGAAVMMKMQPYMQKVMADVGPDLLKMQMSIIPKVKAIMSAK